MYQRGGLRVVDVGVQVRCLDLKLAGWRWRSRDEVVQKMTGNFLELIEQVEVENSDGRSEISSFEMKFAKTYKRHEKEGHLPFTFIV